MFKIYKNILNKKEKNILLAFVKTKVQDLGENYPGLQTYGNLHTYKELNFFLKKINKHIKPYKISMCWGVCSIGNIISWHQHYNCKYSFVYYLHNPNEEGTMFVEPSKYYDFVKYTKGSENTLLKFDGLKRHSMPNSSKKIKRYTISFDVI
tara:strand:- start:266 stop:718 length:453 start_codon:yes stop_codon:yes gene_type:complete